MTPLGSASDPLSAFQLIVCSVFFVNSAEKIRLSSGCHCEYACQLSCIASTKYRVGEIGVNRQQTDGRPDGIPEHIMPPLRMLWWRRHG